MITAVCYTNIFLNTNKTNFLLHTDLECEHEYFILNTNLTNNTNILFT